MTRNDISLAVVRVNKKAITNVQHFLTNFFHGVFGRARRYLDWLCCVALHCVAFCCLLRIALRCVVLCCDVMLCVVICLLLVTLVCWLEISQFSCVFIARLDATTRRTYNGTTNSTT